MKQLLIILFFLPTFLYSQSEGGFGFRRFANTTALNSTSVSNSDKNASRRAYVHSTGLYYRWNGSAWAIEETIDTFSVSGTTLRLSILNDGQPAKTVDIAGSIYGSGADSTFVKTNGSYFTKRITSNVTRGGTTTFYGLGGSSTDTTGVVNISQDENSSKPSIWFDGNQQWIFKIEKDSRGDSLSNINFFRIFSPDQSVVGDNQVTGWGINVTPGGGKEIPTNGSISLRMEEKYTYNGKTAFEVHLPDIQFKNTGGIRPFSGVFSHLQADGGYWGMYNDYLLIGDYKTGTQKVTWGFGTNTGYNKGITFLDSAYVFFSKSLSNSGIFFKDSANVNSINAMTLSSSNEVYIGSTNTTTTRFGTTNLRVPSNGTIWTTDHSNLLLGNSTNRNNVTINGASTDVLSLRNNVSGSNIWSFGLGATNFFLHDPSGNNLIEAYTNANASLIIALNKWGFGKSPGARLDLQQLTDAASSGMGIANSGGTSYYWSLNSSGDMLWWQTGGSQRMMLTQAGDLLLGTSGSPARKLHVVGEARITDLTTDTPTRIVGADADGDLGGLTVGTGLTISGDSLKATGGSVNTLYTANGSTADGRTVTLSGNITWDGSGASNGKAFKVDMGTQEIVVTKNSNIAFNNSPFFATLTGTQGFYIESSNDGATSLFGMESGDAQSLFFVDDASPEGVTTATIGSMCFVQDAGVGKMYLKKTGSGNTGWVQITADNIYNANGTTTANTRNVTVTETLNIIGTADITDPYPFQVKVTGNEPRIQLWKGNTDSVWIYQSDVEYHFGSSTVFQIESNEYLAFAADSIKATTLATKTKIQNIVGISDGGTLQQIEGTSGNQVLKWNASGYWELGTVSGAVADGDYGDITVSSSGTVWTIDAGVVSNSKIASGAGGIYKGSGTIASGAVSTLTAASTWRVNYSGATAGLLLDDTNNAATISGANGTYAVSADNSSSYMTGALSSTFTLGSTGGTTLTASVANTNTVNTRQTIITNSSGTAATGLGTGTLYQLETSTTNSQDAAEMDVVASDATHATRTFDFVFKTVARANALAEAFRIGGTTYALTATASVSNTNTAADRLIIKTNSTGTPSTNFGGSILFQGESSTTDNRDMARISVYYSNATDASRTTRAGFSFSNSGGALVEQFVMSPSGLSITSASGLNLLNITNSSMAPGTSYTFGGNAQSVTLGGSSGLVTLSTTNTASGAISLSHNTQTATATISIGAGVAYTMTSGTKQMAVLQASFAPTSGTATFATLANILTVNQTGGANGITRGFYDNPTLTAIADYRSFETAVNSSSAKGFYQTGSSTTNTFVGATGFGATTAPTDKVEITGNLALLTAGNKIKIATGSNASVGTATLVGGTVTVNTTAVTASSKIFLTYDLFGGIPGSLEVGTITAGTSFVINSSSTLDTSDVNWWIIN